MVFFLDNSHLLGPQVVAPSWSFTDMTPYAFDDTYESSSDDDNTALAISRSIYIVWGNKKQKKDHKNCAEATYFETSLKSFADYKQSNRVDARVEWRHVDATIVQHQKDAWKTRKDLQ